MWESLTGYRGFGRTLCFVKIDQNKGKMTHTFCNVVVSLDTTLHVHSVFYVLYNEEGGRTTAVVF